MLLEIKIAPVLEPDIDRLMGAIGASRAHPDADRRALQGGDYVFGNAAIELKGLDDEGLSKLERQERLAALFRPRFPERPVIILDPALLGEEEQGAFYRVMEGPIKTAVATARKQLRQTRVEHSSLKASILFVINNGYTALDHETLMRIVTHRVRQDTEAIDGIVVAGMYLYSDGFDSFVLCPIDYIPIHEAVPFEGFEALRSAWNDHTQAFMTDLVRGQVPEKRLIKDPVGDLQFDVGGVTYVKPAPPMGMPSEFYSHGRPRNNSTGLTQCPVVAKTLPRLNPLDWSRFKEIFPEERALHDTYDEYRDWLHTFARLGTPLKVSVTIPVSYRAWAEWASERGLQGFESVKQYATELFHHKIQSLLHSAAELIDDVTLVPDRYVVVATEEIGQDQANDVSHIMIIEEEGTTEARETPLATNIRAFHEYAMAIGAAHAVARDIDALYWCKDLTYAWV